MDIRRAVFALTAILVIVFLMEPLALFRVADANPKPLLKNVAIIPNATPPTVTIISPLNNTVYNSDKVTLCFRVTKPQMDNWQSSIFSVGYRIDNNSVSIPLPFKEDTSNQNITDIPEYFTTFTSPSLTKGNHTFRVTTEGILVEFNIKAESFMMNYSTVIFSIENTEQIQPSPTLPTTTPTATFYVPPNNRNAPHLDPIFYLIPISVIVAVVAVSVLLFRKRQKKPLT
jgi:hypothetical protein